MTNRLPGAPGSAERHFHAIRIAIIRIVKFALGYVRVEFRRNRTKRKQQARFLVQVQTERRLALGAPDNHVSIMTIDFFNPRRH